MEYIIVFLTQKVFYSGSFSIASFKEEMRMSLSQKTSNENDQIDHWSLEISTLDVSCSGLIHGDITTSNIMVHAQGNLFFIDFGLR